MSIKNTYKKLEGGKKFTLDSSFEPSGDQPRAIKELVSGIKKNEKQQVLLGITGSGKTFTIANVIQAIQKPVLSFLVALGMIILRGIN